MKILWDLFFTFMKIGGFTFGGGYAILPMLEKEAIENKGWINKEELLDYYAMAQCTPGIIAGNIACYVGYKVNGIKGALASIIGVVFPSYIIITIIAAFISNFADNTIVKSALAGIQICVVALIFSAIMKLFKKSIVDKVTAAIFVLVILVMEFTSVSPILMIISMAIFGILIKKSKEVK